MYIDYEALILARQDLQEIWEDDPDYLSDDEIEFIGKGFDDVY